MYPVAEISPASDWPAATRAWLDGRIGGEGDLMRQIKPSLDPRGMFIPRKTFEVN